MKYNATKTAAFGCRREKPGGHGRQKLRRDVMFSAEQGRRYHVRPCENL